MNHNLKFQFYHNVFFLKGKNAITLIKLFAIRKIYVILFLKVGFKMFDTIIIGGGPAGLTAAIYLKRACKNVLVLEKEVFGGQITKANIVENYPGFMTVKGMSLGQSFYEQAKSLGADMRYEEVIRITKNKGVFFVKTEEKEYVGKTVIFAAGTSPRKLSINEDVYLGKGLSYCATCDGAFYKDKVVAIVGGGNTAIDDAFYLSDICKHVYVIHRRDILRAEPIKVANLKNKSNVSFIYNTTVSEIKGENVVHELVLKQKDRESLLKVDGVFVAIGSVPNSHLLNELVKLDESGFTLTNHDLETSLPGLFLAGDIRKKDVRQLTTATSDGTVCATHVIDYLNGL